MESFSYQNNELMAEGVPLSRIAAQVGTPTYVYSKETFTKGLLEFKETFAQIPHIICYAVKTAGNLALLNLVAQQGCGTDIVSGGELFRAVQAGIKPGQIVFSGVGKSTREMEEALKAGILMFNVESAEELDRLSDVAARLQQRAPVALRINPDVDPGTHPYVATGLKESKFGLAVEVAYELYEKALKNPNLEVVGVACHIGSQLLSVEPFGAAAEKLLDLVLKLKAKGLHIKYLDMGGGLGIRYHEETVPTVTEYASKLKKIMDQLPGVTLILEPGRRISGHSGVLLVEVQYNKTNGDKHFVVVDGAMNDLLRPCLYGSHHPIWPLIKSGKDELEVDVVGPVCESGDFLARNRTLPKVESGDLLAVMCAGAYGFTMSSNYNARPRAAEVLVEGDSYRVVRQRETYHDLIKGESALI